MSHVDRRHVHVYAEAHPEGVWVARATFYGRTETDQSGAHGTGDGLTVESACVRAIEDLRRRAGAP